LVDFVQGKSVVVRSLNILLDFVDVYGIFEDVLSKGVGFDFHNLLAIRENNFVHVLE
jgi:hypothetical protein